MYYGTKYRLKLKRHFVKEFGIVHELHVGLAEPIDLIEP